MAYDIPTLREAAYKALMAARDATATGGRCGCGRVYLEFSEKFRSNSKVAKTLESMGFKLTSRPYRTGKSRIYVGYDNATGHAWDMAERMAAVFKEAGIGVYVDGDPD